MSRFIQLATQVETLPLRLELERNAATLWDADPTRRTYPNTPHGQMVDICVRYMEPHLLTDLQVRKGEHRNVFWPAWYELPALRPVVFGLMTRVQAVELGSILITKLPPGGRILPHSDKGSWAAEYYNTKAHWTVQGEAFVTCDNVTAKFESGTVWTFDNLLQHDIVNEGYDDRVCVIVSMRCD